MKIRELLQHTNIREGVPQPGESSGKAKEFKPDAKITIKQLTLDEILKTVKDIPYYNHVIEDFDRGDFSWEVTKKVLEYADYLKKNPNSIKNLPPIIVIDGKLNDGAHRISTVNLLQKRLDVKNPFWKNVKFTVKFGKSSDVINENENATQPGEYVYHASYLPNLKSGLISIQKRGLMPSKSGQLGPGIYFAYKPEHTYYHVSKDEATMFRAKWADLVKLFGTYPSSKDGIQRDDEQIVVPSSVPANLLEVEYFPGEYWEIDHAIAAESREE